MLKLHVLSSFRVHISNLFPDIGVVNGFDELDDEPLDEKAKPRAEAGYDGDHA